MEWLPGSAQGCSSQQYGLLAAKWSTGLHRWERESETSGCTMGFPKKLGAAMADVTLSL